MITTFYPPYNFGGDGIFVERLSNELAKRGHKVDIIHCVDSYRLLAKKEPANADYNVHQNVTVHGLKSKFGFLSPLATQQTGYPFFKANQIRRILNNGFDVIHFHNISLVGGPKILEFGNGIKLLTMHDYWLICPTHTLFRFNRSPCVKRFCFTCSVLYKRPPQWWRYFGFKEYINKNVDALISPSQFSKNIHGQIGFRIPIVHLPNFINSADSELQKSESSFTNSQSKPYFLFVGRLEKLKGIQTIIPIFRDYDKADLLIAGTGNYEPRLRQLSNGCDNIRFTGFVDYPKLQALYKNAVALIVPSLWYENFPLVILEAFREKTPVIARNLGSTPEIIKESGGGLVYNTEDELVSAMDQLMSDQSTRERLVRNGFETYKRKWTIEAHIENYLKLISQLAESRNKLLN